MRAVNMKKYPLTKKQILNRQSKVGLPAVNRAKRLKLTKAQLLKRNTGVGKKVNGSIQRAKLTKAQIRKRKAKGRPYAPKVRSSYKPVVKSVPAKTSMTRTRRSVSSSRAIVRPR